jgi:hypothetical protein
VEESIAENKRFFISEEMHKLLDMLEDPMTKTVDIMKRIRKQGLDDGLTIPQIRIILDERFYHLAPRTFLRYLPDDLKDKKTTGKATGCQDGNQRFRK